MPGPNPVAAGDTSRSQWWIVSQPSSGSGRFAGPPTMSVVMATAKPRNAVSGPYTSKESAEQALTKMMQGGSVPSWLDPATWLHDLNPSTWLSDIGGKLASGIEAGFLQILKDIWNVIAGPLEVLLGVIIGLFVLIIYFKNDIAKVAGTVGSAMAMAA